MELWCIYKNNVSVARVLLINWFKSENNSDSKYSNTFGMYFKFEVECRKLRPFSVYRIEVTE